jgi:hypothetical protein
MHIVTVLQKKNACCFKCCFDIMLFDLHAIQAGVNAIQAGVNAIQAGVNAVQAGVNAVQPGVNLHRSTLGLAERNHRHQPRRAVGARGCI